MADNPMEGCAPSQLLSIPFTTERDLPLTQRLDKKSVNGINFKKRLRSLRQRYYKVVNVYKYKSAVIAYGTCVGRAG